MAIVVLLILAAVWAIVLVPPLLRSRTQRSGDSIDDFNYRLGVLGRTNGTVPVAPESHTPTLLTPRPANHGGPALSPAAKRRRDVLTVLAAAVAATFILATVSGASVLWALQILSDVLLVAYVGLLAWFRSLTVDRDRTVAYLPHPSSADFALRRTASS